MPQVDDVEDQVLSLEKMKFLSMKADLQVHRLNDSPAHTKTGGMRALPAR